jgi:cytochrome c oxidase assembly factor CtaG
LVLRNNHMGSDIHSLISGMNTLSQVNWSWDPSVVAGFCIWTLFFIMATRGREIPLGKRIIFHTGTLIGLLALVSPIDELGDEYLFSAHMVQHLPLLFIVGPLWLLGTPMGMLDRYLVKAAEKPMKLLLAPITAFFIFVSVLWFWHIPFFYDMAQESETIHIVEHITFIGAGLIGWWPVAGPRMRQIIKPEAPVRMLYLCLLAVPCTSLAAILVFSKAPLFPFYVTAPHIFGLSALQDQHLGGLLMWLPTHMVLLLAIGITFLSWFNGSEVKQVVNSNSTLEEVIFRNQTDIETQELGV